LKFFFVIVVNVYFFCWNFRTDFSIKVCIWIRKFWEFLVRVFLWNLENADFIEVFQSWWDVFFAIVEEISRLMNGFIYALRVVKFKIGLADTLYYFCTFILLSWSVQAVIICPASLKSFVTFKDILGCGLILLTTILSAKVLHWTNCYSIILLLFLKMTFGSLCSSSRSCNWWTYSTTSLPIRSSMTLCQWSLSLWLVLSMFNLWIHGYLW